MHPRSPKAHSVFGTRALLLCQPSEWSGWQDLHLRPPRSGQGRLLLTIHPENGCQGWTRTNTERLNRPPCYFHTTWQLLIGAAGRIPTCISPLRRRMPDIFGHDSNLKWSERQDFHLRPRGPKPRALKTELRSDKMADPKGLAPSAFPQTTGCSDYLSYGSIIRSLFCL